MKRKVLIATLLLLALASCVTYDDYRDKKSISRKTQDLQVMGGETYQSNVDCDRHIVCYRNSGYGESLSCVYIPEFELMRDLC